jgi:hypothetical protein
METSMPEREDPADSTERRDWDLPPDEEPADIEQVRGPASEAAPEPDVEPKPADETERRDWDLPPS